MRRVLQSLLVLISLLAVAFIAAAANGAELPDGNGQAPSPVPARASGPTHRPLFRHLTPGPQPGTHLQTQPFAYGYFGAYPPTTASFHRGVRNEWYQWTFGRGD